ncbi:hypothetical protein BJ742DRAFT_800362 [Cladochytrium replicatum]|nr:hypothetical protein BJ742DRAFT_800362 [Cladochytrium replicatum]
MLEIVANAEADERACEGWLLQSILWTGHSRSLLWHRVWQGLRRGDFKALQQYPVFVHIMGTRNLTIVYYKGRYCIAQYGQWDGYPEGTGVTILEFISDPSNLDSLKSAVDSDVLFKAEENAQYRGDTLPRSLNRDTGAMILNLVANATEPVPIVISLNFIHDTLFCEWAYVVDLDEGTFEVFGSCRRDKVVKNSRFEKTNPCCGVWKLDTLPTRSAFVNYFQRNDDDVDTEE